MRPNIQDSAKEAMGEDADAKEAVRSEGYKKCSSLREAINIVLVLIIRFYVSSVKYVGAPNRNLLQEKAIAFGQLPGPLVYLFGHPIEIGRANSYRMFF